MTLYLLQYNNYYNRIVKREESLSAYQEYVIGKPIQNVNFIPNDGVNTTQVINWGLKENPDYLLVVDESGNIESRWFIVSSHRTTAKQFQLTLHRDLVADYYDEAMNAPMFVEKGAPTSLRDPAIYNSEDMTFNQIKQSEILLADETNCAWICGFIPNNSFAQASDADRVVTADYYIEGSEDIAVNGIANWEYYQYSNLSPNQKTVVTPFASNFSVGIVAQMRRTFVSSRSGGSERRTIRALTDGNGNYMSNALLYRRYVYSSTTTTDTTEGDPAYAEPGLYVQYPQNHSLTDDTFASGLVSGVRARIGTIESDLNIQFGALSNSQIADIKNLNNNVILDRNTGIYYRIAVVPYAENVSDDQPQEVLTINPSSRVGLTLKSALPSTIDGSALDGTPDNLSFSITHAGKINYRLVLTQQSLQATTTVPKVENRYHLDDSPYDMFCIPYPVDGKTPIVIYEGNTVAIANPNKFAGMAVATKILEKLSGATVDLQLLPYCPVEYCLKDGRFDIQGVSYNKITAKIGSNSSVVSVVLWATTSRIQKTISLKLEEKQTVLSKKVSSLTDMYRLNSPNYAGSFEFDPQMNDGVAEFIVDCNYIPFGSYIHVAPAFKGLYGSNLGDARGLICGGDFSLPRTNDAWEQYKLQNSTYQQVFDRDIQNLKVVQSVQREQERWQAGAGVFQAFASGAGSAGMAGMATGNPYIAAGAALVGGAASAIGSGAAAARDMQLNETLRQEALNYKYDMFGYSLQNIKALPATIAKTTSITVNNKVFPFVEYYTCTEVEKQALRDKLRYNGFTIMRIGKLIDFSNSEFDRTYVKGRLIRASEELSEDYHIVVALADELFKGVFI